MTLPTMGLDLRDPLARRWRYPFVWRARELSLEARSGQTGTLTRAATGTADDRDGVSLTLMNQQPRWTMEDLDGDTVRESVGLALGKSDGTLTEYISWDWDGLPRSMCGMFEYVDAGLAALGVSTAGNVVLASIASAAGASPYLAWQVNSAGQCFFRHHNGTTAVDSTVFTVPTSGQRVQLRWRLNDDGSVQAWVSINQAAETAGAASGTLTPAAAWSDAQLFANKFGSVQSGSITLLGAVIMLGDQSRDRMLEALA